MKSDPIKMLKTLLYAGYQVYYADTDLERLRHARSLGAHKVIDATKISGESMLHPEILIKVKTINWHTVVAHESMVWPDALGTSVIEVNQFDEVLK